MHCRGVYKSAAKGRGERVSIADFGLRNEIAEGIGQGAESKEGGKIDSIQG